MDQQLYDLPDGWEWSLIDNLCEKITDGTHKTPTYIDEGIPFLSVKDMSKGFIDFSNTRFISEKEHLELFKRCNPEYGDVLYSKVGTTGVAQIVDTKTEFSLFVSVALLKPKHNIIDSKFLEKMLNSPNVYEQAQDKTRGVANRNLVLKDIKSIILTLPPLPEQKRIVEKLDALLSRIDQAVNYLQESLRLAEALFASSLDGAFNPLGSIKNNESVFELPEGWEWKKLEDVITNTKNINPTSLPAQEWTYIDISSINRNKNTIEDPKIIIGKEAPSRAKKEVIVNDVLFATTRPNLKNIAFVDTEYNNPIASTGFCILRATEALNYKFLFYFLVTDIVQKQIEPFISGASYPAITDANLKRISFPLPPLSEQKRIVEKLDHLSIQNKDLKEKLQSQIDDLNALKASLLDAAFRGEL